MQRPIAIAAAAGALAAGGTAIATASDGGPLGDVLRPGGAKEHRAEFARDLASKLDGVEPAEVERALGEIRRERRQEHRARMAKSLSAELDGVGAGDVEQALEKAHARMHEAFRKRERPTRDLFVETLASELGKKPGEIRKALKDARKGELEKRLDEAVKEGRISEQRADRIKKRLEQGPPGFKRFRGRHHGRLGIGPAPVPAPHGPMGAPHGPMPGPPPG